MSDEAHRDDDFRDDDAPDDDVQDAAPPYDDADDDQQSPTSDHHSATTSLVKQPDTDPADDQPTTQFRQVDADSDRTRQAWSEVEPVDADQDTVRFEPSEDESVPEPTASSSWLQRNIVLIGLAAVLVGALVAGGIAVAMGAFDDRGSVGDTDIGESERLAENAFTQSGPGDCLTWPANKPGEPVNVPCAEEHRFEVAGALNTAILPGSEFGESAPWPGPERFGQIRDEQCPVIVNRYLDGRLDPQGRFSVGLMYPPQDQWVKGARELRCGLQVTGADGTPQLFAGKVADQDQSFQWAAGTCIGINPETRQVAVPPTTVSCSEPHAFQTTGIVDLAQRFGDKSSGRPWPAVKDQNAYLATICPAQAERFVGGKAKLDATTLNVQWSVIGEPRWLSGSRKVVCYLGLPDGGGFATLVGDARGTVLINGKLPVAPSQAPPGRALPTPVPLPQGVTPNPLETPAPAG
ncbi:septum formation family protein [Gordonia sp. VNQ95]|uniref:septum formation family protein n=1 Tax=Gordonia sp. VNQ95 TaxID=3156619 RepID=UPI0032B3D0E9